MRYLAVAIVGFSLGLGISCSNGNPDPPKQQVVETKAPQKLPKEVQEQFDAYLLTSPVMEVVVVRIVKKILESLLVASVIALLYDYPLQAAFLYIAGVALVSYPISRFLISRAFRTRTSGPTNAVLSN